MCKLRISGGWKTFAIFSLSPCSKSLCHFHTQISFSLFPSKKKRLYVFQFQLAISLFSPLCFSEALLIEKNVPKSGPRFAGKRRLNGEQNRLLSFLPLTCLPELNFSELEKKEYLHSFLAARANREKRQVIFFSEPPISCLGMNDVLFRLGIDFSPFFVPDLPSFLYSLSFRDQTGKARGSCMGENKITVL